MFNLDNFDLDFDDDFSSSIFSKDGNKGNELCESDGNKIQKENKNRGVELSTSVRMKENIPNLKRPSLQDDKPQKKRFSHEGLPQRKFPGPAGLLPDKPYKEIGELVIMDQSNDEDEQEKNQPIYSQSSGSAFLDSPYQKLMSDFGLNETTSHLNKYTVEWAKKTAINKGFQGRKIPFLGVVVHCVDHSMPDPVLLLRDPTGEIKGSLHREVWAEMGGKLHTGIALALRQVGVLVTGVIRRQIYLNITINNILAIYRQSEDASGVETTPVNKISKAELLESVERWKAQPPKPQSPANNPPVCLFSTVDQRPNDEEIRNLRNKLKSFVEGSKGKSPQKPPPPPPRPRQKEPPTGRRNTNEVLANLGIELTDGDFSEEMNVPLNASTPHTAGGSSSSQALSQAESLIFEEVLSGIDLDEFEM